jgi:polyisoprenoid-binding protein YceI
MKPKGTLRHNDSVFPIRPFRSRRQMLIAGGAAAGLIVAALTVLFLLVLPTSAPEKLAISASSSASSSPVASGQAAGSWTIAKNSVAGYRVREQLAFVGAPSDAVGRTSSVTGTMSLAQTATGYTVSAATFTVDVSTLTSDRSMRDQRIHSIGLQSDRYPTASFKLTTPIVLPATASNGQTVQVSAVGDLTIHGSTQQVTIPMQAKLSGSQIEVAGSITFPFSQFGMTPPNVGGFVSVQNNATMEFQLFFQRA